MHNMPLVFDSRLYILFGVRRMITPLTPEQLADFAYALRCRVKLYISLLNHIHAMMARVFKAAQQHRDRTRKMAWATGVQVSHRDAVQPALPIVPNDLEFRRHLMLSLHQALVMCGISLNCSGNFSESALRVSFSQLDD